MNQVEYDSAGHVVSCPADFFSNTNKFIDLISNNILSSEFIEIHLQRLFYNAFFYTRYSLTEKQLQQLFKIKDKKTGFDRRLLQYPLYLSLYNEIGTPGTFDNDIIKQDLPQSYIDKYSTEIYSSHYAPYYMQYPQDMILKYICPTNSSAMIKFQKLDMATAEKLLVKGISEARLVLRYQRFTDDEAKYLADKYNLPSDPSNYMYRSDVEKVEEFSTSISEEYERNYSGTGVLAYKAVRLDNLSFYNYRFKYETGKSVLHRSDYSCDMPSRYSYGLYAGTKDYACKYGQYAYKLMQVEILFKDVTYVGKDYLRTSNLNVVKEI